MLTIKQLNIFEALTREMFKEYTIGEIKKNSGEKSNNAISLALRKFKEEELVVEKIVGRSKLYSLNLNNDLIFSYITLINQNKLPKLAMQVIEETKIEVEKYTSFFAIAVFGSYSIGAQKKDSDLDLAVFVENEEMKKKVQLALNSVKLKSIVKVDSHSISQEEFLEMLKVDYENLGKEIARKHLLIYHPSIFYSILKKGIKNGFRL